MQRAAAHTHVNTRPIEVGAPARGYSCSTSVLNSAFCASSASQRRVSATSRLSALPEWAKRWRRSSRLLLSSGATAARGGGGESVGASGSRVWKVLDAAGSGTAETVMTAPSCRIA